MKTKSMRASLATLAATALVLGAHATASAAIFGVAGGTAAPSPTLGPYTMTAFPDDPRPVFTDVSSVPSPLGGDVGFSPDLNHRMIGNGWATWSHGYMGSVYFSNGATSVTLAMPADTGAFYLYAEPRPFAIHTITATAQDGTQVSQDVDGDSGASYYGFYGTGGSTIVSITVSSDVDFAIGEFGIALVPEPASLSLLGLAGLGLVRRRRN